MASILMEVIDFVFHLWYQVFDGIVYAVSVIMLCNVMYTIPYREMCYLVNRLGMQFSELYKPKS
jgi:hypothetical protein